MIYTIAACWSLAASLLIANMMRNARELVKHIKRLQCELRTAQSSALQYHQQADAALVQLSDLTMERDRWKQRCESHRCPTEPPTKFRSGGIVFVP